jgi:DNA (cytosine-5)-methyltransferase 1
MTLTFGSLFAGIGGFDLGFARAGLTPAWQVEINPYCRSILAKRWPDVRRHDDVRTFPPDGNPDPWRVDVIAGGFPCQDVSKAATATRPAQGLDGARSGLWSEFARVVCLLRPKYCILENVPELCNRGLDRVLGDLAQFGFDAEWHSIPAAAFGAPHKRYRLIVVAYPAGLFREEILRGAEIGNLSSHWGAGWKAHAEALRRVDDGLPGRLGYRVGPCDDLAALGNALVPQLAEWIGRCILDAERRLAGPGPARRLAQAMLWDSPSAN